MSAESSTSGVVKRVFPGKGFGFIRAADGHEYFFHKSALRGRRINQVRERDPVLFEVVQGPKGPRAEAVRVLA